MSVIVLSQSRKNVWDGLRGQCAVERAVMSATTAVPCAQLHTRRTSERRSCHLEALAVEPQAVVLGQTEVADRCFIIDAGVRPMPVVAVSQAGSCCLRWCEFS